MRPSIKFVTHFRCSPEKKNWRSGHSDITAYSIFIRQFSLFLFFLFFFFFFFLFFVVVVLFVGGDDYFIILTRYSDSDLCGLVGSFLPQVFAAAVLCKRLNYSDWPSHTCATTPPQNKVQKAIYIRLFWLLRAASSTIISYGRDSYSAVCVIHVLFWCRHTLPCLLISTGVSF